jgi:Fe-S-cluster-containing dehydrogenase component
VKSISRRSFLKAGLVTAGAACASQVPLPAAAKPRNGGELATLIDIRKCIGCESCVDACREANDFKYPKPQKPFPKMYPSRVKVADWSGENKREVSDRLTPYNWLFIQWATVKVGGEEQEISFPRRCMHCQNPPCADLCPWGAARKLKNGITMIHPEICMGGRKCQVVCPWDVPQRQTGVGLYLDLLPNFAGNGVMYKCDRCYNRIAEGELPACIEDCPEDVQIIGPRTEIIKAAHRQADEENAYIYGENENGGTNTIYLSPVPFEVLNQAIAKGPGKSHFDPVEDQMAHADNLAKAMLIAPFAGFAAAVSRVYKATRNTKQRAEGQDDAG